MDRKEGSSKRMTPSDQSDCEAHPQSRHSKSRRVVSRRSPLSHLPLTPHNNVRDSTKRNLLKEGCLSPVRQESSKFGFTRDALLSICRWFITNAVEQVIPEEKINPLLRSYTNLVDVGRHPDDMIQGGRGILSNMMGRLGARFFTIMDETKTQSVTFALTNFMYVFMPMPVNGASQVNEGNMTHMVHGAEGSIVAFHLDEIFGSSNKTSKIDGMPNVEVTETSSSPSGTVDQQMEQATNYLATGYEQSLVFLRRLLRMRLQVGQLPEPPIQDNRDSWNRLVVEQKLLINIHPRTKTSKIGKADTGGVNLGPIVAKKLATEEVYVNAFKQIAKLLPGCLINGHYVVHYSKEYGKLERPVEWVKPVLKKGDEEDEENDD
eukprot:scaffold49227_cov33-Cyclotella_meneghiniana.AAC.3